MYDGMPAPKTKSFGDVRVSLCTLVSLWLLFFIFLFSSSYAVDSSWIRINQLGYTPNGLKVAVWCAKGNAPIKQFSIIDSATGKTAYTKSAGKNFGSYGPFSNTYRLNFTDYNKPGIYYLKAGNTTSPVFKINKEVYKGTADLCLFYMRQQRSGFNPFLKDSCHTHDGYTMYGPMKDSTHIDVGGGWHDASDYLQYSTTSANATWHLLAAYRDFPKVFTDRRLRNGLDGTNGIADVLDEARWGLDWLLKMHPRADWMFNQIADDRDHMGMRIPKEDTFYGRGFERPVYFINGEPQQRGKFMNNTTGTTSTAAKFSSAFALGNLIFKPLDPSYAYALYNKSLTALNYSYLKPGVSQTVSVRSPYIYAEDNWVDDIELAAAANNDTTVALLYARQEPVTPWLGGDSAKHYQWYPFINLGHYELAKQLKGKERDTIIGFYKEGIRRVWNKAHKNAFYRGIPFIWCSNNLTASFTIQCYWYKQLSRDHTYDELAQANLDWLFGCNPWGTSMVYGLPSWGDSPVDPHSAFTHIKNYPITGGLVDGPVYTSIYKNLIGISLKDPDEYAEFQSDLAVYHDDYGDYSSNEPTMDGTASLVYLLASRERDAQLTTVEQGGIIRGKKDKKNIALVLTGDEYAEGGNKILQTLNGQHVKASFFFTGKFYRNPAFKNLIYNIKNAGHYLGPHSNEHLLYADWNKRDSLLVKKLQFKNDLNINLQAIEKFGVRRSAIKYFIPPYEWYNDSIAAWSNEMGLQLINYSPGTKSNADYTTPDLKNYRSSDEIYRSILEKESSDPDGLNGFILLMHIGVGPERTDKFYDRLGELIEELKGRGYGFTLLEGVL